MTPLAVERRRHCIVIGASMAGLLAARVAARHFSHVTLVERDVLPDGIEGRRGVPQGRHTHGLLASGRQVLERFFPGLTAELVEHGAVAGDLVRDCRWHFEGAPLARPASGLDGLLMSRPFLESHVRQRVVRLPNVRVEPHVQVDRLVFDDARRHVTGVVCGRETLAADLVIDATGRGSRTPVWLAEGGYAAPPEEKVDIGLAYTTRLFRRTPAHLDGDLAAIVPPTPYGRRGGVMLAQEHHRWTVTLISHFGQAAPEALDGFIAYTASLPSTDIHEVVRHAEPIGDAASARFPSSVRRRYERLRDFPDGYLVIGDGISSFNPIYGQGMSVAALEAEVLDAVLADGRGRLAGRFFARAAHVVDIPWSIAVGNDLRMPETVGPRGLGVTLINAYMARLHRAAHHDPQLAVAFHRVANLLAQPASVMHPRLAWRVLGAGRRGRGGLAARRPALRLAREP